MKTPDTEQIDITDINTANSDNLIILRQNSLDRKFCTKHDAIDRIVCNFRIPIIS